MTWQTYHNINIYFVVSGELDLLDFSVASVHIQNDTYKVGGLLINYVLLIFLSVRSFVRMLNQFLHYCYSIIISTLFLSVFAKSFMYT